MSKELYEQCKRGCESGDVRCGSGTCECGSHSPAVVKESCDCGSPDTGARLCRHACNRSSCTQECLLHSLPCNECSGCDNVWKEMAMGDKAAARLAKADNPNKASKPHESHRTDEEMRQTEHGHHTSAVTKEEKRFRRAEMKNEYTESIRQKNRDALVGKKVVVMFEGHKVAMSGHGEETRQWEQVLCEVGL